MGSIWHWFMFCFLCFLILKSSHWHIWHSTILVFPIFLWPHPLSFFLHSPFHLPKSLVLSLVRFSPEYMILSISVYLIFTHILTTSKSSFPTHMLFLIFWPSYLMASRGISTWMFYRISNSIQSQLSLVPNLFFLPYYLSQWMAP